MGIGSQRSRKHLLRWLPSLQIGSQRWRALFCELSMRRKRPHTRQRAWATIELRQSASGPEHSDHWKRFGEHGSTVTNGNGSARLRSLTPIKAPFFQAFHIGVSSDFSRSASSNGLVSAAAQSVIISLSGGIMCRRQGRGKRAAKMNRTRHTKTLKNKKYSCKVPPVFRHFCYMYTTVLALPHLVHPRNETRGDFADLEV